MRLLQLDAGEGKLPDNIVALIDGERPDIVCLQSVVSSPHHRSHFFDLYQDLQKNLHYQHHYFSPTLDWQFAGLTISYGNLILSKFPFLGKQTHFSSGKYKADFKVYKDNPNVRNIQHVIVRAGTKPLHILNYHGYEVPKSRLGNIETNRHFRDIAAYVEKLEGPAILSGNLNLVPNAPSLAALNKVMVNLCRSYKLETTRTILVPSITEVVDHVFVNKLVQVQAFNALDDIASDHTPLLLEFDI